MLTNTGRNNNHFTKRKRPCPHLEHSVYIPANNNLAHEALYLTFQCRSSTWIKKKKDVKEAVLLFIGYLSPIVFFANISLNRLSEALNIWLDAVAKAWLAESLLAYVKTTQESQLYLLLISLIGMGVYKNTHNRWTLPLSLPAVIETGLTWRLQD